MCLIFIVLFSVVAWFWLDQYVSQWALSESAGEHWVQLAQGWDMLQYLWPVFVLGVFWGLVLVLLGQRLFKSKKKL